MRKSILAVMLIATALCVACKQKGGSNVNGPVPTDTLETATVSVTLDTLLRAPYALEVNLEMEYVTDGRLSEEVRNKINYEIIVGCLGDDYAGAKIDEIEPRVTADLVAQFSEYLWDDETGEPLIDWFDSDSEVVYSSWHLVSAVGYEAPKGYISYTLGGDEYHYGAAHGYYYIGSMLFDLATGDLVHEDDLFVEGYRPKLTELLETYVVNFEDYEEDFLLVDSIEPNDNFSVNEDGITYFFNPYEITAYAYGIVDITIPWDALKEILKPDLNFTF